MRKHSKFAIALAAVTLAASTGALVACDKHDPNDGNDPTGGVYTVTFNATSDTGAGTVTPTSAKTNAEGKLTLSALPTPTSTEDLKFEGWYVSKDGSGTKVTLSKVYDEDTDLYAKWGAKQGGDEVTGVYTITFHANGGEFDDDVTTLTRETANGKLSSFVANPYLTDESDERIFGGWYLNENGTGNAVTLDYVYEDDTDLYANWVSDEIGQTEYAITFDANGGTVEGDSEVIVETVDGKLPTIPTPDTREDYTFDGWFTKATGGVEVDYDTVFDQTSIVFAHWTKNPDPVAKVPFYLYATVDGEQKWSFETGYLFTEAELDSDDIKANVVKKYKLVVSLNAGDIAKIFKNSDGDDGWDYNNYEQAWEYCKYEDNNLNITKTGTFTFWLKVKATSSSVWVNYQKPLVIPEPADRPVVKLNGTTMTDNTDEIKRGPGMNEDQVLEYIIEGVELGLGDSVSFTVGGKAQKVFVENGCTDIDSTVTDTALSSVTTTKAGVFRFYLKQYISEDWVVYGVKTGELTNEEVGVHTVTFNANGGSVATASAETDENGRLSSLPTPTPPANKVFDGWFTAAEGGDKVTTATVFGDDATIYAQYSDVTIDVNNCIMVGTTAVEELKSIPADTTDTCEVQYGAKGVMLNKDDVVKFNLNITGATGTTGGKPVQFVINKGSKGLIVDGIYSEGTTYTTVKIAVDGAYDFYIKHYENDGTKWVLYAETSAAGAEAVTGTETPSTDIVAVNTNAANTAYMVGDINATGGTVDKEHGILLTPGDGQFSITYHLEKNAIINFRLIKGKANGTDHWANSFEANCSTSANFTDDGNGNIKVLNAGTYTFYVKTVAKGGQIWVEGTPDPVEGESADNIVFGYNYSAAFKFKSGETIVISFTDKIPSWADQKAPFVHIWLAGTDTAVCTADLNQQLYTVEANLDDVVFKVVFTQDNKWKATDEQQGSDFVGDKEYVYAVTNASGDVTQGWVYGEDGIYKYTLTNKAITYKED